MKVGVQTNGSSPSYTKRMAVDAVHDVLGDDSLGVVTDVGGGQGELARLLAPRATKVFLLDYAPPNASELPANVEARQADLNKAWPLEDNSVDLAVSTEVIEHCENPRHFFREIYRVIRPGGYAFITTPNNHSIASKLTFLLRGEHRFFQDPSYPAHITPILRCDFKRMAAENGLRISGWYFSNTDTVPRLHWRFHMPGVLFSDVIGVLVQKV